MLIFSKEKIEATLYRSKNKIFLSIVERKISRASCFGSDKAPTRQVQIEPES